MFQVTGLYVRGSTFYARLYIFKCNATARLSDWIWQL